MKTKIVSSVTKTPITPYCICVPRYRPGGGWQHSAACYGHRERLTRVARKIKKEGT